MKKRCVFLIIIILFCLSTMQFSILTNELDHHDSNLPSKTRAILIVGSDQSYEKIQDAIDNASSGDTIRVYAGTYYENIFLNKTLTLMGDGSSETEIHGSEKADVVTINANWCNISNLFITKERSIYSYAGIKIFSNDNKIEFCRFLKSNIGIAAEESSNNAIENCTASDNDIGFSFGYVNDTIIKNCLLMENKLSGLNCLYSNNNTFLNCSFSNNNFGVSFQLSNDNLIEKCSFNYNDHSGLIFSRSTNNQISNCSFNSNSIKGIYLLYSSNNNLISLNSFIKNIQHGIQIELDSVNNEIFLNDFINNNRNNTQAFDNCTGNSWNSTKEGNYWSDWLIPDYNKDRIVDDPYIINNSLKIKDYFPLTDLSGTPQILTNNVLTALEDEMYSIHYRVFDPDTPKQNMKWHLSTNASFLSMDNGSGILSGIPLNDDVGIFWTNVSVSDGELMDFTNFTLDVLNVNDPPTNTTIELVDMVYYEGHYQPAFGNATDEDLIHGDNLTFTWFSNVTGEIGTCPSINLSLPRGMHTITLNVTDKNGSWCSAPMEIEIFEFPDIDNDGIPDYLDEDNDNDNLPDEWEIKYFGNINQNPFGDYDNDGFSNYYEYSNNTDPTDPNDPEREDDDSNDKWESYKAILIVIAVFITIGLVILIFVSLNKRKKDKQFIKESEKEDCIKRKGDKPIKKKKKEKHGHQLEAILIEE